MRNSIKLIINYAREINFIVFFLFAFYLINPFQIGFIAGYLILILIYTKKVFLIKNLDIDYFLLLAYSIVYSLFYLFNGNILIQTFIFYLLFPPGFYLLGKYFVSRTSKIDNLYFLFFFIGLLFSVTALISVSINLLEGGFKQLDRSLPIFWNGKITSATLMGAFFTLNMCIPSLIIMRGIKLNIIYKISGIVIFIISLLCVFRLGSRTQIVICLITSLSSVLFFLLKHTIIKNLKLVFLIITLGIIAYLFIPFDLDADYLSVLGDRLQKTDSNSTAGNRTQKWSKSLINLFTKPFGWSINEFGYSHNLWLDVAQSNGIIPFSLLVIFTIKSFFKTKKLILYKSGKIYLKNIILIYMFAIHLLFFVEPVILGVFSIFVVYCFFQGATNKYLEYLISKDKISK